MTTHREMTDMLGRVAYLPNSPVNDENVGEIVDTFLAVLEEFPADMVSAAVDYYLATGTYFPTPSGLRDRVVELWVSAADIPMPAVAWGYVLDARRWTGAVWCKEGARLRDAVTGTGDDYWNGIRALSEHTKVCEICKGPGDQHDFRHPAVAETVRRLGGLGNIFTGNLPADRSRFIEAFRDVVAQETKQLSMPVQVRTFVEEQRARLVSGQVGILAAKLDATTNRKD